MGRIAAVLIVLLIGVAAAGFYLDWWRLNKTTQGEEIDITLSVDKNKIKKDTDAAVERVQQAGKDVAKQMQKAVRPSVEGTIASVSADDRLITVTRETEEPLTLHIAGDTTITRDNAEATSADLQVGQRVTVVHETQDGKNVARSISVASK